MFLKTMITDKGKMQGFLNAWKRYGECVSGLPNLPQNDIDTCMDVLKVLQSDVPWKLFDECCQGYISRKTLDEAEDFDFTLNKLRVIPLSLNEGDKQQVEQACNGCVSFFKFIIELRLKQENRLLD